MNTLASHLKSRHLDMQLHCPVLDEENDVATFFLWNLSEQLVGYQQYRRFGEKTKANHPKEGKYFTYKKQPTVAVWGVESLHLTPHVVFLCEGVFDAARLTDRGYSALAALSNDPSLDLKNWLLCLNRRVVSVCDSDAAGRKLAKFGHQAAYTQNKDLGECSDSEVSALLAAYG